MSEHEAFRQYEPRDDVERRAAAGAVVREREQQQGLAQHDALTPFERELAQQAFGAGQRIVLERIAAAIGPAAETVRADLVRRAAEGPTAHFDMAVHDFRERRHVGEGTVWTSPGHVEAARLVATAHQLADPRKGTAASRGQS